MGRAAFKVSAKRPGTGPELVRDPVCGRRLDPARARHEMECDGERYYFCSETCSAKFEASLDYFLGPNRHSTGQSAYRLSENGPDWVRAVRDPVCGRRVEPAQEEWEVVAGDSRFRFCSSDCKSKFEKNLEYYLGTGERLANKPGGKPASGKKARARRSREG